MRFKKLCGLFLFVFFLTQNHIMFFQKSFAQGNVDNETFEVVQQEDETEYLQGKIVQILEEKDINLDGQIQKYQKLKVLITKGFLVGKEIIIENGEYLSAQVVTYHKNDNILITYVKNIDGSDVYTITDFIRTDGVLILFIIFIAACIIVGSKKGLFSLLSLAISFFILFIFVLPEIQAGKDPVLMSILASIVIVPVTFYISHGFERKTTVAILGTVIAMIITGILSSIFVNITHLTGTSTDEAMFLQVLGGTQYNLQGLLLAGIIIGTLGVMDDITISQTAIVYQLYDLKNDLHFSELFKRAINIGKDHIASMINTLVLVYTGAAMPLLLLFMNNPRPFDEILNFEMITTEIVRTLVGSIGLILAVPITTYIACYYVKKGKTKNSVGL